MLGSAHILCGPRGHLDRGAISGEMNIILSAMPSVISLMQVPLRMGGSAALITLATWRQRSGSAINGCRSAVFQFALLLFLLLQSDVGLLKMRTVEYTRLWSDSADSRKGDRILVHQTSQWSACFIRMKSMRALPIPRRWLYGMSRIRHIQGLKEIFQESLSSSAKRGVVLPLLLDTSRL